MNQGFYGFSTPDRPAKRQVIRVENPEGLPTPDWRYEGTLAFFYNEAQLYRCNGTAWERVAAPYNN